MTVLWIWRRKNKLTEHHRLIWKNINIVAEIVSSSVMLISEQCTCEMKKENQLLAAVVLNSNRIRRLKYKFSAQDV